jgi:TPR repeat protein
VTQEIARAVLRLRAGGLLVHAWLLVMAACGGGPQPPDAARAGAGSVHRGDGAGEAPAVAVRACARGASDVAPCVEDCNRGIAFSCAVLAWRIERGEGIVRDDARAVRLYERACELDEAPSCVTAARMHAAGVGVPPNRARQLELLALACALGDALACELPARAFANGSGVPRDAPRAAELRERACAGGVERACAELERDAGLEE